MKTLAMGHLLKERGGEMMNVIRRLPWLYDNLTARKLYQAARAGLAFAGRRETSSTYPLILKVDISPLCNLRCTICVHADPGDNAVLGRQRFATDQRMTVAQLTRIADEVAGHTAAASLYYLGDPLTHPDLDELCGVARSRGLNVHLSSNFSFALSDARVRSLLASGVTHLTICVDGLSQETYARTRVGGRIDRVLDNLGRLTAFKREMGLRYPRIEVQYIKFRHNQHEFEAARRLFLALGVEQVSALWGDVHNYTDVDVGAHRVFDPLAAAGVPRCYWPYLSMVIRYDGDVIPCCEHRMGEQYARDGETRAFGNVFEAGVAAIWNSPAYRRARRMAVSPGAAVARGDAAGHFCEGCSRLYHTDRGALWRSGRDHEAPPLLTLRRKAP